MKKIIILFQNWLFDFRKKRAIKQADQLAKEQRMKQLVLVYRGKPVVLSMQNVRDAGWLMFRER